MKIFQLLILSVLLSFVACDPAEKNPGKNKDAGNGADAENFVELEKNLPLVSLKTNGANFKITFSVKIGDSLRLDTTIPPIISTDTVGCDTFKIYKYVLNPDPTTMNSAPVGHSFTIPSSDLNGKNGIGIEIEEPGRPKGKTVVHRADFKKSTEVEKK